MVFNKKINYLNIYLVIKTNAFMNKNYYKKFLISLN